MRNVSFCANKECVHLLNGYGRARMVRIYIRQHSDEEVKYPNLRGNYKKQFFRPIGWLCPFCKNFSIEKEYQDEIQTLLDDLGEMDLPEPS